MNPQVLTCDIAGIPHAFVKWEDAIVAKVKGTINREIGSGGVIAHGGISRITGNQSVVDVSSIICLNGSYHKKDKVTLNNHNLFRRDLNTCGYCGRVFREEKLTRDHIIPRSRGGKDTWKNVITACKACNNYKDSYLLEEINANPRMDDMHLKFQPYAPSHSEELILKNKRLLREQLEYLLIFVPPNSRLHRLLDHHA